MAKPRGGSDNVGPSDAKGPAQDLPTLQYSRRERPASQPLRVDVARVPPREIGLYWMGLLPVRGDVDMLVDGPQDSYSREVNPATGLEFGYQRLEKTNALREWSQRPHLRRWLGACGYQNMPVHGWTFHAFSEIAFTPVSDVDPAGLAIPGQVVAVDHDQVNRIIHVCANRNFIRRPTHMKTQGTSILMDVEFGKPPEHYNSDDPWQRPISAQRQIFNPDTDKWAAEFVYIVKLSADPRKTDPKRYHLLIPDMEEFLENPPEPLARFVEEPVGSA